MIGFNHTVTDRDRAANPDFDNQIKAEWPAILRWMINGCLDWQREGLNAPKKVLDASKDYLDSQDKVAAWMANGCIEDSTATTLLKDLFASWKSWCEANGEYPGTSGDLANLFEELGFKRVFKHGSKRAHSGLCLVTA